MKSSWRRRCDAWAKHQKARAAGKLRGLSPFCRNWAVPGKTRCYLHGGRSTGPRTPAGRAASTAAAIPAMREGRRRRIAQLALEGKKINTGHNGGRYPKDWPMTPDGKKQKRRNPALTTRQQLANLDAAYAAERNEQKEIRRLLRTIFRGSFSALSANRDEALIAKALDALHALRQKWHDPR
jgi:hypothetical protein